MSSNEAPRSNVAIESDVVERMVQHHKDGTTDMVDADLRVPVEHFVCDEYAAQERSYLKTLPLIVGHSSEIPEPGDFVTRNVMGESIVLVRRSDGTPACYRNMCRHRGAQVETRSSGRARLFVCNYHGWSYHRDDGLLANIPQKHCFGSIERGDTGLQEFKTEELHGFVFADFSNDSSRSLTDFITPELAAQLAPWGTAESVIFKDKQFELNLNWKLLVDGAMDSLHPPYLHPQTVARLVNSTASVVRTYGPHCRLYQARRKFAEQIEAGSADLNSSRYITSILSIYPNSLFVGAPDHVEFWTIWPSADSARKSTVHIRFLVRPSILTAEMETRINKSYDVLINAQLNEDWPMEDTIQGNINANPGEEFIYGRGEVSAQHLHRELQKGMGRQ